MVDKEPGSLFDNVPQGNEFLQKRDLLKGNESNSRHFIRKTEVLFDRIPGLLQTPASLNPTIETRFGQDLSGFTSIRFSSNSIGKNISGEPTLPLVQIKKK